MRAWRAGWRRRRDFDRVYVKDPAGLLTPERARTLFPALRARLAGCRWSCTPHDLGLSPLTYLVAAELGVRLCTWRAGRFQRHVAA